MWFHLGEKNLIAKKIVYDEFCDIFVCDFVHIWRKTLKNDELMSIFRGLNPLFEASEQKIKQMALGLLDEDKKTHKEIKIENSDIILRLESASMGVKFQFQVVLKQQGEELFYKEFTLPFMLLILRMKNKEKKLVKIIQDKDVEIENFKEENYVTKKNSTATEPFSESMLENEELLDPVEARIIGNPNSLLECIDKKLFWVKDLLEDHKESLISSNAIEGKYENVCEINQSKVKHKNICTDTRLKPCVNLGFQTIKKRKVKNDSYKIKF